MKAKKPNSAEPAARPSRPSVTFTAWAVAKMISVAQMTHTTLAAPARAVGAGERRGCRCSSGDEHDGDDEGDAEHDLALPLPEDAAVAGPAHLHEVVDEAETPPCATMPRITKRPGRRSTRPGGRGRRRSRRRRPTQDGDAAHRRRACLVLVLGAAVLSPEDGLAPARGCGRTDREAGPDQRDDHGDAGRDEQCDHRPASSSWRATSRSSKGRRSPATVCVVSWPLPAMSTTSPGRRGVQRQGDRRAPIGLGDQAPARRGDAGQHVGDDGSGILAAGVVRGDDHHVGAARPPPRP